MRVRSLLIAFLLPLSAGALAADAGLVKVAQGRVEIERAGVRIKAEVGTAVQENDVVITGADGAAGITFADNSLLSIGPGSTFAINAYRFDTTTHAGEFTGTLTRGRLAAVSGKMVKQAPESMKIRTPSSVMGVRGTEFVVQVDEPPGNAR
jgi:hypothetical protein